MKTIVFFFVSLLSICPAASAASLPKWAQGTWADDKVTNCAEINSPSVFKDGGFIFIRGNRIQGHEWACEAGSKQAGGEYAFDCGGEGEEFTASGKLQKVNGGLVISWSHFGAATPKRQVWRFPSLCRKGPPAFWGS